MADVIFIVVIVAFFALCAIYVRWCDSILGADELAAGDPGPTATGEMVTT